MSVCDDNENRTLPQTEEILFYLGFHDPVLWNMGILNKLLGTYFIYLPFSDYIFIIIFIYQLFFAPCNVLFLFFIYERKIVIIIIIIQNRTFIEWRQTSEEVGLPGV